jgi:hypothetical protein
MAVGSVVLFLVLLLGLEPHLKIEDELESDVGYL